jgi:alkylation response protein AidB-like acyl-CoA dehydrogenase
MTEHGRGAGPEALMESVRRVQLSINRAAATDDRAARRLPEAVVQAVTDSGLLAMKLPRELGGLETDLGTQVSVIKALAMIDASVAWCVMVGSSAIAWPAAFLDETGIGEVFRDRNLPRAAVAVQPSGRAERVQGGLLVTGRWKLVSGIHDAEWLVAGVQLIVDSRPRGHHMVVIPAASLTIHDDWTASGLYRSDSCSVTVEGVYVPLSRTWNFSTDRPRRGGLLSSLGWPAYVTHEMAAFALGIGQRCVDNLITMARDDRAIERRELAASECFQRTIAESRLELRASEALVLDVCSSVMRTVQQSRELSAVEQAEARAVAALATERVIQIATNAFRLAGGAALDDRHGLHCTLQDILTAGQHWVSRTTALEAFGAEVIKNAPTGDNSEVQIGITSVG